MIVFDGHEFEKISDLPDLGSFRCTDVNGLQRSYMGLAKDVTKLPTAAKYPEYKDLATGSSAYCLDTGDFYFYSQSDDVWYAQ